MRLKIYILIDLENEIMAPKIQCFIKARPPA